MADKSVFETIKSPEECEKKHSITGLQFPVIRFVPEQDMTVEAERCLEVTLRISAKQTSTSNFNTVRRKIGVFQTGSVEALLCWRRAVQEVILYKPWSTPEHKFNMTLMLLEGDPKATWVEICRTLCDTPTSIEPALGRTDATYGRAMKLFMAHYFPRTGFPARKQKRYLQQCLHKPRGLKVRQVASRLKAINRYLPLFPQPENTELSEGTLVDILVDMCPRSWIVSMSEHSFEPAEHTFEDVQAQLEKWENHEEINPKTPKKSDSSKEKEKKGEKKRGKKKKWEKGKVSHGGDEPPCKWCKLTKGNASTHATSACNKKRAFEAFLKEGPPKKKQYKHSKKEMNAIVEKEVKRHLKRKLKKNNLAYSSDEADSDSS